jgi:hypothetical protein
LKEALDLTSNLNGAAKTIAPFVFPSTATVAIAKLKASPNCLAGRLPIISDLVECDDGFKVGGCSFCFCRR